MKRKGDVKTLRMGIMLGFGAQGSRSVITGTALAALLLLWTAVQAAGVQVGEYPQQPRKLSPAEDTRAGEAIKEAIRLGHIVSGMDQRQVLASLGEPIRKIHSSKTPGMEHWLYRVDKLHQEQFRGRGWSFVRITFRDGRVIDLNPR